MSKLKILMQLVILFIIGCFIDVNAASANLSVSSSKVYVGDSFTVFVNMSQAAAWNIHVSSSGPVSGCTINEADSSSNAENISKQFSASCKATQTGNINISLSGDLTSAPTGDYSNISGSTIVQVSDKPQQSQDNNSNSKKEKNSGDNKSENSNLKSISVDGYKVEKVNDNNYKLVVSNSVSEIDVSAIAEDPKANISGTGKHKLKIGDNSIEILVVSESGKVNKVVLKVVRKKEFGLDDLEDLLKNNNKKIEISLDSDTSLSSHQLSQIKSSGKTVVLNYKENETLKYSWIIDGNKIKDFDELFTLVQFDSKNKKNISKLSNYAEGMYFSFKQLTSFPDGIKLKVYVKDKYSDGDKVNIYYYDGNKMNLHEKSVEVKDGYIVFNISKGYDHFITMSSLQLSKQKVKTESSNLMLPMIIFFTGLLFLGIVLIIVRNKVPLKKDVSTDVEVL